MALRLLADDAGEWLVQGLDAEWTPSIGKSAADLWAMAQPQHQRGHTFTAAILYRAANSAAERRARCQLGLAQDIRKEMKSLHPPQELQGSPPFNGPIDSDTFRLLDIGTFRIDGRLALLIRRTAPSVTDSVAADAESKRLVAGILKNHADVRDVFDAIAVLAVEAGRDRTVRTIEDIRRSPYRPVNRAARFSR